jgi:hypothetical protein
MSKKVAYITGGMGGIGTAICQRMHKEGFTVIAGCGPTRDFGKWLGEQKALGYEFHASVGNVGAWESTVEAFSKAKAEHGPIDVLVNNAGITRDRMFLKMSREDWDAVIETNLNSMFNVTKQVVGDMVEKGWGRIINISSVNGEKGQAGQTNYSAAKAGMHAGAGTGQQGRDGQHREPGLHRYRHGQGDPPGRAGQDRRDDSGQAAGQAGRDRIDHRLAGVGRRQLLHRRRLLRQRRIAHGVVTGPRRPASLARRDQTNSQARPRGLFRSRARWRAASLELNQFQLLPSA